MIDYLLDPSVDVNPLYIFFDYKDILNQTPEKVIASLLKQLVASLSTLPSSLVKMYDEMKNGLPPPSLSDFVDLFIRCSTQHSVVVLFDAFDECDQRGTMISRLVRRLYQAEIKVCIMHRPHVLQHLDIDFEKVTKLEIRAQSEDVETYIAQQLQQEEKMRRLDDNYKAGIINEISKRADGMYGV